MSESRAAVPAAGGLERLEPRAVPLGGLRAMSVSRTLPQRGRSTISAWCFIDHYGAEDDSATEPMWVTPHPHVGLQTVSWLFSGEIEHRDSIGSRVTVTPGTVSLMTAAHGIAHSEVSAAAKRGVRGVQLWVALPAAARNLPARFEHYPVERHALDGAELAVFLGAFAGRRAPGSSFSRMFGAELTLPAGARWRVPLAAWHELGVLVDRGELGLERAGERIELPTGRLGLVHPGPGEVWLEAGAEPVRALLLGGEPFPEEFVMWWNFIAANHEEIVAARERWQADVIAGGNPAGRFGTVAGGQPPIPAPELPAVRLKPRGATAAPR